MTEEEKKLLRELGVAWEESIQRFLGNESLYIKFLMKFPQDQNYYMWKQSLQAENYAKWHQYAHTLKGVAGNLGLEALYTMLNSYLNDLRADRITEAKEKESGIIGAYEKVIDAISRIGRWERYGEGLQGKI